MDPSVVFPVMASLGLGYVAAPIVAVQLVSARKPHRVTCPEIDREVLVDLDLGRAALTAFTGGPQRVCGCTRWPERAGCDRACEAGVKV